MSVPTKRVEVELEVPFHDVDTGFIVWHGHYYKYLEIARTALMRAYGLDVEDVVNFGFGMVVSETRCRHGFPLRYGERFKVAAWFRETERRIAIGYEITNLTQQKRAARAQTTMVTTDANGKLCPTTPSEILERLQG